VTDPDGPCPSPRVRLTANQTLIDDDPDDDAALAARFAQRHVLELPDLLQPDVLERLAPVIHAARFVPRAEEGVGARLRERPTRLGNLLCLLLRSQALRDWLTRITGVSPLADVNGAVARFERGGGQGLDWHNDLDATGRDTGEILFRHNHRKPGSALVFRVSKTLQHRVTPVSAGGPRTVFSGWYLSEPLERRA
jgi:hypothetical protein